MSENTEKIKVMLADDHPILRECLVAIINREKDMRVVAEASDGAEAVEQFRAHLPDVTLMDLQMPVMNGVAAIAEIRKDHADARIILLTTYDGDENIYQALKAGARGYLLKDAPADELLNAIRVVRAGKKEISPHIASKLADRLAGAELTQRETEVLQLIVAGKSNAEIAAALFVGEGTVKFHINHIFDKLGAKDRTQAVIVALQRGLAALK